MLDRSMGIDPTDHLTSSPLHRARRDQVMTVHRLGQRCIEILYDGTDEGLDICSYGRLVLCCVCGHWGRRGGCHRHQ